MSKINPFKWEKCPLQMGKMPLFIGKAVALQRGNFGARDVLGWAFFPFEGVYLRHLDWLSVNIILKAKSHFACGFRLGPALIERPALYRLCPVSSLYGVKQGFYRM